MDEKKDLLNEFIERNKFSIDAWNERGLNPSNAALCESLENGFNSTALLLIDALNENRSHKQLKNILLNSLASCKTLDIDTEEKEFVVDLYLILANIIRIDIRFALNVFLYGYFIVILMKIGKLIKPDRVLREFKQKCTRCDQLLIAQVMQEQHGIPEKDWLIGKCLNCAEHNLFSYGPNIKRIRFSNYFPEEYLSKQEYSYDQALTRLEQVKYFRK